MKKRIFKSAMIMASCLSFGLPATYAQNAGTIDSSWASSGWVLTNHINNQGEFFFDLKVTANNKIVQVGRTSGMNANMIITRHNANGAPDLTFGNNGMVIINNPQLLSGNAVEVLYNDKILVCGYKALTGVLYRLNSDGSIDNSFGTSGEVEFQLPGGNPYTEGMALKVLSDNSILAGATSGILGDFTHLTLYKFTQGGGPDVNFGTGGIAALEIPASHEMVSAIDVASNGKIAVCGETQANTISKGIVAVFNADGTPDLTFNNTGYVIHNTNISMYNDVKFTPDNKIIVAGHQGSNPDRDGIILKYNADGSIDPTFGTNGNITLDIGVTNGILLQRLMFTYNNNLIASGHITGQSMKNAYALKFDLNGAIDNNFGSNSGSYLPLPFTPTSLFGTCLGQFSDGSVLLGGFFNSTHFGEQNMYLTKLFNPNANMSAERVETLKQTISVYPNPASKHFSLRLNPGENAEKVELYSMTGHAIQAWDNNQTEYSFNHQLAAGQYILIVRTNNQVYRTPVIIKQ